MADQGSGPDPALAAQEQISTSELAALQQARVDALLRLPLLAEAEADESVFLQAALEITEELTGSQISFIHFVNDDQQTIELVTWSKRTLEEYCQATFDRHYPVKEARIWADALRSGAPVVFNSYADYPHKHGLPEGHARLDRLISLPVIV